MLNQMKPELIFNISTRPGTNRFHTRRVAWNRFVAATPQIEATLLDSIEQGRAHGFGALIRALNNQGIFPDADWYGVRFELSEFSGLMVGLGELKCGPKLSAYLQQLGFSGPSQCWSKREQDLFWLCTRWSKSMNGATLAGFQSNRNHHMGCAEILGRFTYLKALIIAATDPGRRLPAQHPHAL